MTAQPCAVSWVRNPCLSSLAILLSDLQAAPKIQQIVEVRDLQRIEVIPGTLGAIVRSSYYCGYLRVGCGGWFVTRNDIVSLLKFVATGAPKSRVSATAQAVVKCSIFQLIKPTLSLIPSKERNSDNKLTTVCTKTGFCQGEFCFCQHLARFSWSVNTRC